MKKRILLGRDLCPKGPFEEEIEPRMDANGREWGKSYWLFVIGYWGKRKKRLFDFLTNNQ
jgi:hypothetical protein